MIRRRSIALLAFLTLMGSTLAASEAGAFQPSATCDGLTATIVGTEGDDRLIGTAGPDVIAGLGGNDIIRGLGGNDVLCGDNGRDRLFGGPGRDRVFGGKKNDIVKGDAGKDMLFGNQGNDRLFGGGGGDRLEGGSGTRDKLFGKGGSDTCIDPQATTVYDTCEVGVPTRIGSSIPMTGFNTAGIVTVHAVVDPALPESTFDGPDPGKRLTSVLVSLEATTGDIVECDISMFALIDSAGQSFSPLFKRTTAGPEFGCLFVGQGDVRAGWVTFEIPESAVISKLKGALDNLTAPTAGEWDLRNGSPKLLTARVTVPTSQIGATQSLAGRDDERMRVTVVQLIDPASPVTQFDEPEAGNHIVAAELIIENTGPVEYDGLFDVNLIVADGLIVTRSFKDVTSGVSLDSFLTIAPGASLQGWIVFEVSDDFEIAKLHASPDLVFGEHGEWRIP